jgi:hypothetical protein
MRVSQRGVSVWYGTLDAPAPSGVVAAGGDTSVTVGLEPPDPAANITVLYRINHGPPHFATAQPTHPDHPGKQYFKAELTGFKNGDKVEYVAVYRSHGRQIPSTQEAEGHVATFTVGAPAGAHATSAQHQGSEAEELTQALHAVLRTAGVLNSAALETSFVKLYFSHSGNAQEFWQDLQKHPELNAHVEQLQFALQIDLLTSGHLPLIEAIVKLPAVKSMRDLALLDAGVWQGLIARSGVPQHIHIPGATHEVQVHFYTSSILGTLQAAFPTLTVWKIAAASHQVDPLAAKFLENSPDFDIRTARVDDYVDHHAATAFKGITDTKKDIVIKEVKRLQRLFAASTNADTFRGLLETKLDSAHAMALVPRATFVLQYAHLLGGTAQATAVHARALFINARNIHLRTTIHDAVRTPATRGLGHHSPAQVLRTYATHKVSGCPSGPTPEHKSLPHLLLAAKPGSLKEDLVKRFPNSEELFGSISLCNCEECESAIGPAAYLVDVLDFLGASKPNPHHVTPLDVLIGNAEKRLPGRRPDLAFMNLTCANTNTAMPYIDIVNEILESYIALGLKLDESSTRDSANSTSAELDANPQYINHRAYELLDLAVYPFTLPFNRPLSVARSYLNQLGTSRFELLKTFHKDQASPAVRNLLAAEFLGISGEEFQIITGQSLDPTEKVHPRAEGEFYGFQGSLLDPHDGNGTPHSGSWTHDLSNVATFLQRTGLTYADLHSLVSTRFVSPDQPTGQAKELLQRIPVSHSSLAALLKSNLTHPAEALVAIQTAGISAHELSGLRGEHFDRMSKSVVIDDVGGTCDPASMWLRHFDGTDLGEHVFGRMHRFIRLFRKTGWSIADLDRAIHSLGASQVSVGAHEPPAVANQVALGANKIALSASAGALGSSEVTLGPKVALSISKVTLNTGGVTPDLIIHLAHIKQLQERLHIKNLQQLLAMWAPIESRGPDSLFRSLFLNKATHHQGVDVAFDQSFPDSPVLTTKDKLLQPYLSILQSALRVTALDLTQILQDCGYRDESATLNLENVSALYRRASLAKALKLTVRDFLSLKTLWGRDPFASPEETLEFANLAASINNWGLSAGQLSYLVRHLSLRSAQSETEPRQAVILGLARDLRDGLTAIARDNVFAPDPSGSLTTQKLALLYGSEVVEKIAGIINGTVNYSSPLITLPSGVAIPPELAKKVSHNPIAQLLICKSPLTSADRAALLALSTDQAYHAAVDSLYQEPLELIKTVLSPFLEAEEAQKKLVTESASLDSNVNPIQFDAHGKVTTDPGQAQKTAIAEKFEYVLRGLLPYLITTLGASLLKRTISESLKTTDLMTQRLLDVLLNSRLDSSRKAAYDLHSLQSAGATAAYYASPDQTGTSTTKIDRAIAFDGSKNPLPSEARSVSWTAMIAPTASGDFEFILRTNGTPVVWLGDIGSQLKMVPSPNPGEWISEKFTFKARQLYYLRIDVTLLPETTPNVTLLWQSMTVRRSIVPEDCLYPSSVLEAFRETYILLQKAAVIINGLRLNEDEVLFLAQTSLGLPALNFNALPVSRNTATADSIDKQAPLHFASLIRAARLAAFRRDLPLSDTKLTWAFDAPSIERTLELLVSATGWDAGLVADLVKGFALTLPDFRNEQWLLRLKKAVRLSDKLGVSPNFLFEWSTVSSGFAALEQIGQEIKKCVQGQYDAPTWLTIAKPLNDKLRDAQRNALIAYLLPRMGLRDSDQLFEYFLIDAEMGVCTETSRISLAHSSVQLFVQRCLMNLEDTGDINAVSPHQIDSDQWEKWRKHYRFWQANYQVLLHPEHWMSQAVRDDKTPFFATLESELTQNEITAENVETAYLNYLEKLEQVARLEIIGTFWQDKDPDTGEAVNTLHIFGRTFHYPQKYFYRTFVNFTTWTPWEEMQVTIEGDHVMPLIWNRRLYVFWPVFTKKVVPPPHPDSVDPTSKSIPIVDSRSFWQVSLAWTELRHNKWTSKQVSKNAFDMDPGYFVEDDPARYAKFAYSFKTSITREPDGTPASLIIRCVFHGPTVSINRLGWFFTITLKETTEVVGAFEVGGCNGESVEPIFGTMPWPNPIIPEGTDVEALTYVLHPSKTGLSLNKAGNQQAAAFLHGSPSQYRLLYPHQYSDYLLQAPLFYQDKHRTFFVTPHDERSPVHRVSSAGHAAFHRVGIAAASRAKAAAAHGTASHAQAKSHGAHAVRHVGASEVSDVLMRLERLIRDVSEPYSKHASGRHSAWDSHALSHNTHPATSTHLKFETFYHPFVCSFMKSITRLGINGLLTEANQRLAARDRDYFAHEYKPTDHVTHPFPAELVDFDGGPYAIYNQELFFHIPDLIHERLHQNRRYFDAIRWLKYIFDPTDDTHNELPPERYWKYVPLKKSARDSIQQLLALMESGNEQHSQLIADWARHPFQPYAIARHRPEAYKKNIFIKFVRTLIDHADTLFLSDSKEAINEAQQLYIMAAHLLGPKPEKIPPQTKPKPECYASLRGKLDTMSSGLVLLENEYPFSGHVVGHPNADSGGLQNVSRTLYFCAPQNAKLLELWDIVADRLFKIRNCMNIEGIFRQLALFDPPIDPELLVRAAALGIDLGSVMGDIQAPLPAYRFTYMLQKAREMCNECKSFGNALLSALEKNDAEALAVMRSTHEVGVLDMMHRVKIRQVDEANAQVDALNASRNTAVQRYSYYQTLMGITGGATPAPNANIPLLPVPSQPSVDVLGIQLIPEEGLEIVLSTAASILQMVAGGTQAVATGLYLIPQINAHGQPVGVGATLGESGLQIGEAVKSGADTIKIISEILSLGATLSGKMGTYFRRQAEWALQNNLAACEIMQIDKQIATTNIRVEIAQHELKVHEKQLENATAILEYMTDRKFTNKELYGWMVSDLSAAYFSCYQMAFAQAKKAERAFRFERGLTESNFIQFGYWDSLRKGLLAGDKLDLALLQLEAAYTDQNTREYEISRDLSLLLNAPLALIALKETGMCEIAVPESFFDADYPGHYMRRLKNVTLSVPCVVGPYTSLNCTLTLMTNKTRVSNALGDQYAENLESGDDRFVTNFAAVQSIATSHGTNDAGLFEVNFRDERYLPFEGGGVVSRWRLEMRKENNAFDFESISDAILHFKYTAREGGEPLRQAARQALSSGPQDGRARLFSVRHEFPSDWNRFLDPTAGADKKQAMTLDLGAERFPYQFRGKVISMEKVELFLSLKGVFDNQTYTQDGTPLGDYAAGKPLSISVTPPGGNAVTVQLKSSKSLLNGLPHGIADFSDQTAGLGPWTIDVQSEGLSGLLPSLRTDGGASRVYRLKSDALADLTLVFHYSVG